MSLGVIFPFEAPIYGHSSMLLGGILLLCSFNRIIGFSHSPMTSLYLVVCLSSRPYLDQVVGLVNIIGYGFSLME